MKRIPVTKASYKKIPQAKPAPGKPITAVSHSIDKEKSKVASFMGGLGRATWNRPTMFGGASSFYQNSYMGGGSSGFGDMPQYFAFLNEQNGGVLYYPVTLKEKYEWYRYFFRNDPYVHAAISLHTDLPMSKLVLRMPKMKDKAKRKRILAKYQTMVNDLKLFEKLHSILFETNVIGNCFPAGNRVVTPEGLIDISLIRKGQTVLSNNGVYNRVSNVMRREVNEEIIRFNVSKLEYKTLTCTKEHPIFVLRNDEEVCIKASELLPDDFVSISYIEDKNKHLFEDNLRRRITPKTLSTGELEVGESESIRILDSFLAYGIPMSKKSSSRNGYVKLCCTKENMFAFYEKRPAIHNEDYFYVKKKGNKYYYKINELGTFNYNGTVYNLEVEKDHTFCVEHINTHNCFVFVQYNDEKQIWDKIVILPPEEIDVANYPMSDIKCVQYRPEILNSILSKYSFPLDDYNKYCKYVDGLDEEEKQVLQGVDFELVKQLKENNGALIMDTNPYSGDGNSKIGSFVFHFCEKRHEYQDLGVSPLECILTPLLMKEHYKHTQLSLASRNMTPRNIVSAEGISKDALDDLRDQIDQSMLSPDYSIVTNYSINWETIGAENRLIDLSREYESIENQIFAGLGATRELLTGEGMYSGNKISVEILNTKYLFKRELLQHFVEDNLFKPYALQNGFFEDDEEGNRVWFYPKLSFTRLTIRDNSEVFDSLFQLYQKGSIPIGTILDLFNLDEDEVDEKLKKDMFTVKDATYNDMLRSVYSDIGTKLVEGTDIAKQIIESITGPLGRKLVYKDPESEENQSGGDEWGMNDGYDDGGFEEEGGYDDSFGDEEMNYDDSFGDETSESNETDLPEVDNNDIQETVNDIVNPEDLQKDLENQSNYNQDKMVEKYLQEIQDETNEEAENKEPNIKESFKVAKKSE